MFRDFKKQPRLAMAFSHEFCTLIILENISRTWIIYLMFEECFVCAIAGGFLPFCSSSHCQIRKIKVCGAVGRHVLAATLTKDGFIKRVAQIILKIYQSIIAVICLFPSYQSHCASLYNMQEAQHIKVRHMNKVREQNYLKICCQKQGKIEFLFYVEIQKEALAYPGA